MKLFQNKKHLAIGILLFNIYFFMYYWSINYLNFGVKGNKVIWGNIGELIFKRSSTFLFEPVGVLQGLGIQLLISPMNILMGLGLGTLVFLNIMATFYIYSLPKQCRIDQKHTGLYGILPSFLTGFACCAPSLLIPIAGLIGGTTVFFTKLFNWFLPISVVLLIYGLYKSFKFIQTQK